MKYYVFYIKNNGSELKGFKTKRSMEAFIKKLPEESDDNWIEFTFKGTLIDTSDYIKGVLE